ncbi:MAG: hypothetical protein KAS62_07120 [Candidatus Delongbacteria bacterium]|nr:hypothetical protein [Candidatus Delongbacteria bacterium]
MEKSKLSKLFRELKSITEDMGHSGFIRRPRHHDDHKENTHKNETGHIVKHFNNFLSIAKKEGFVEEDGLFKELKEDTSLIEIFVDSSLLSSYLREDKDKHRHKILIHNQKIEDIENELRIKELKIEEKRLAKMDAEMAEQEKEINVDIEIEDK